MRVRRTLGIGLATLTLVGCGGSDSSELTTSEAEHAANRMVQEVVDKQKLAVEVYVGNPRCVADGEQRWQCVVQVDPEGEDPIDLSGTLTCDGTSCIWKTDS